MEGEGQTPGSCGDGGGRADPGSGGDGGGRADPRVLWGWRGEGCTALLGPDSAKPWPWGIRGEATVQMFHYTPLAKYRRPAALQSPLSVPDFPVSSSLLVFTQSSF